MLELIQFQDWMRQISSTIASKNNELDKKAKNLMDVRTSNVSTMHLKI